MLETLELLPLHKLFLVLLLPGNGAQFGWEVVCLQLGLLLEQLLLFNRVKQLCLESRFDDIGDEGVQLN